jgi:hypothetical protein
MLPGISLVLILSFLPLSLVAITCTSCYYRSQPLFTFYWPRLFTRKRRPRQHSPCLMGSHFLHPWQFCSTSTSVNELVLCFVFSQYSVVSGHCFVESSWEVSQNHLRSFSDRFGGHCVAPNWEIEPLQFICGTFPEFRVRNNLSAMRLWRSTFHASPQSDVACRSWQTRRFEQKNNKMVERNALEHGDGFECSNTVIYRNVKNCLPVWH